MRSSEPENRGKSATAPGAERLLFEAASVFESRDEREAFLAYACRDDPAMREAVGSLLGVRGEADDFFEFEPTIARDERDEQGGGEEGELGVSVGRYRLIERLGAGGCGVVYLAEQLEPVRRKVALKIVRLGLNTREEVAARFEAEAQALASLNHPHIARVLDAGTSNNGVPFLVMELVDGERITEYCDSRQLDVGRRLELFLKVCRAIQHAHQRSVVHRDIKPSNILVETHESVAVVKVIDFGIAGSRGASSGEGEFMGTPAYMSPELALGTATVDTQSDVYSLGVLLAELLAGRPRHVPEGLLDHGIDEVRRVLREVRPMAPSETLRLLTPAERGRIVAGRAIAEDRLQRWCERDFDWVVRKAVDPDPSRRYPTINGLAMDVERCLRQEPVVARPSSRRYRLGKLVRRNRVVFVAGAIAILGLLGGGGMATFLFFREREAKAEVERALATEAEMRARSENWARVAEATVRVRDGDLEGADELLSAIPLEKTPSSLEAVSTFRQVAEWHLVAGRIDEVDSRFLAMAIALARVDQADSEAVSLNLIPAATAVCLSHDRERYDWFREMAIERFGDTRQAVVAEQIVKACLLRPADEAFLADLKPLADRVERALEDEDSRTAGDPDLRSWACFSLALFRYREAELGAAAAWVGRCLTTPAVNPTVPISARIVLGLVAREQGRPDEAEAHFRRAVEEADGRLDPRGSPGYTAEGFWFDWANVRLLLEEAGYLPEEGA